MHLQTHILSGWCLGNLARLNSRERFFCMLAAGAADLDGLSRLAGQETYWDYHHVLGHNVFFGLLIAIILACFSASKGKTLLIYTVLFHLHLTMDYFGSGPDWAILYFWPFSKISLEFKNAWEFYSWQNISAAYFLVAWTLIILVRRERTPLEYIMPNLDRKIVDWMRKMRKREQKAIR